MPFIHFRINLVYKIMLNVRKHRIDTEKNLWREGIVYGLLYTTLR